MIAPQVLNNCNMILDGMSMAGRVLELTLPKIAIKKEDYRAGGMDGPISMDQGMEQMEFGFSISGVTKEAMGKMALVDGLAYDTEFRGAFMDWRGKVVSATAIMRGRLWELDPGKWKPGDKGEKLTCWPLPETAMNMNMDELGDLGLTDAEEDAIVAFMQTLSDGYLPPPQQQPARRAPQTKRN